MRRVDHVAVADIDPHVIDRVAKEHEIAGLELRTATGFPRGTGRRRGEAKTPACPKTLKARPEQSKPAGPVTAREEGAPKSARATETT